jgi:hypothetical protein
MKLWLYRWLVDLHERPNNQAFIFQHIERVTSNAGPKEESPRYLLKYELSLRL